MARFTYALNMAQATSQLIGDGFRCQDQESKINKSASHHDGVKCQELGSTTNKRTSHHFLHFWCLFCDSQKLLEFVDFQTF